MRQTLPSFAEAYGASQRREIQAATSAATRLWARMGAEFDESYRAIEPTLLAVTATAQERVAAGALAYIPAVLEETGQILAVEAVATPAASPLVGVAGDGRPVQSLLYGAVVHAKTLVGQGVAPAVALERSGKWLTMVTGTLLSDTGRQAESLGMGVRPVSGYVRMLNPPSCSRCAILAGRRYRKSEAFERHPGCDCRHIPASEAVAGDMTTDVDAYFDSLTEVEQDRIFTVAGAEAIRNGADIGQVVNARRGMAKSQSGRLIRRDVYGQQTYITSEGTARRGWAYHAMSQAGYKQGDVRTSGRYFRARAPRLMPESIAEIASDREDYLRLLRLSGYIT